LEERRERKGKKEDERGVEVEKKRKVGFKRKH